MGLVELATVSFGQSFQITPIELITTVSSFINGGTRVTPHFGVDIRNTEGEVIQTFTYPTTEQNSHWFIDDNDSNHLWIICRRKADKRRNIFF